MHSVPLLSGARGGGMETFHVYMPVSQLIFNLGRHFLYIYKDDKSTRCPCDDLLAQPVLPAVWERYPKGGRAPVHADKSG